MGYLRAFLSSVQGLSYAEVHWRKGFSVYGKHDVSDFNQFDFRRAKPWLMAVGGLFENWTGVICEYGDCV